MLHTFCVCCTGLDKDLRSHGRDFRARADDKARDLGFR